MKERCQGQMPQLVKWQVARGDNTKLSQWSRMESTDRGEVYPFCDLGYREIGREESGASIHKLVSCELRKAPLELGLGHSTVVAQKSELTPSVVCTGELPKGLVDQLKLRFQQGVERANPAQEDKEGSCEQILAPGPIGLCQVGIRAQKDLFSFCSMEKKDSPCH
jgi:hypothetical protein